PSDNLVANVTLLGAKGGVMPNYQRLANHLARQTISPINCTFAQVEGVLGAPLPASARTHRPWWANDRTHTHARAWLDTGWQTQSVDMARESVTFVRQRGGAASTLGRADAAVEEEEAATRTERDSLGELQVPASAYY